MCIYFNTVDEKSADVIVTCRMKPEDFTVLKTIGRGAFGEVQLVSKFIIFRFL